jgi:hypothetical protein
MKTSIGSRVRPIWPYQYRYRYGYTDIYSKPIPILLSKMYIKPISVLKFI